MFKRGKILFITIVIAVFVSAQFCYAQGEIYSVKVEKNYLALRTAKAFDWTNEIGQLYTGDLVEVQDTSDPQYWYVYAQKLGQSGYVNKDYLVPTNQQENHPEPAPESAPQTESQSEAAQQTSKIKVRLKEPVANKYQEILANVASYSFGDDSALSGKYQYAFVAMTPGYCPALLIAEADSQYGSVYSVRVFQYDEGKDVVYQPEETLAFGVAAVGGFRGGLAVEGDGNGLVSTMWSSGTGETDLDRITLVENTLNHADEWNGRIDLMPTRSDIEIVWNDLVGAETANNLLALEIEKAETATTEVQTSNTSTALPQDGNRVVLQGTVKVMTYTEILALQGKSDLNIGYLDPNETKTIFLLDSPQELICRNGDGNGTRSGTATMLRITGLIDGNAYNGKHITASFDPANMWWPSDASVPLGEPSGGNDMHILQE